ncbi:uncharacterized protein HD556DRAFT_1312039 [Suillus plorans]|uniref:Uncharacterized protein n=1 Tax=Suillus plorans TaxID=116603 RepID=A0A9P7AFM8_9AGAM|nr:uncharacterized protein HD556DRAFT_1312039 [Suillus plorans]KAG1788449.1 hypothetical protein HD556DRAFT_1312039 [Suillus plorans]
MSTILQDHPVDEGKVKHMSPIQRSSFTRPDPQIFIIWVPWCNETTIAEHYTKLAGFVGLHRISVGNVTNVGDSGLLGRKVNNDVKTDNCTPSGDRYDRTGHREDKCTGKYRRWVSVGLADKHRIEWHEPECYTEVYSEMVTWELDKRQKVRLYDIRLAVFGLKLRCSNTGAWAFNLSTDLIIQSLKKLFKEQLDKFHQTGASITSLNENEVANLYKQVLVNFLWYDLLHLFLFSNPTCSIKIFTSQPHLLSLLQHPQNYLLTYPTDGLGELSVAVDEGRDKKTDLVANYNDGCRVDGSWLPGKMLASRTSLTSLDAQLPRYWFNWEGLDVEVMVATIEVALSPRNNPEHLYCDLIDIRWTIDELGQYTSPKDPDAHGCASFNFSEIQERAFAEGEVICQTCTNKVDERQSSMS